MNKEFESVQNEIDRLLEETSEEKTNKKYREMMTNEEYKSTMKKIGKLLVKLERLREENRNIKDKRRRY